MQFFSKLIILIYKKNINNIYKTTRFMDESNQWKISNSHILKDAGLAYQCVKTGIKPMACYI